MKVALLAFAGSESTLGLSVVADAARDRFPDAEIEWALEPATAKDADYLLVSLYWWRDFFELARYLSAHGIDVRKRKPTVIIGGMCAVNPRPLHGMFNYCVVGDGEVVIGDLLHALETDGDPYQVHGVWNPDGCRFASTEAMKPVRHTDVRTNKTDRIEIARGCRQMCDFCQLAWSKPYRELPLEQVTHLIRTSKTKSIALFAPDLWSHSKAEQIETVCLKNGKNNTGSDVRLDEIERLKHASRVRFGLEGFAESTREKFRKIVTNERFVHLFSYMANGGLLTPKGKRITTATMYLIADLPGEGLDEIREFWDTMRQVDEQLEQRFTLFLSVSSFAPSPHTPMWGAPVNLSLPFKHWFESTRPRFKNIVIATRGGLRGPASRLCQMLTIRGDERHSRAVFYLANKALNKVDSAKSEDGALVRKVIRSAGCDPDDLLRRYRPDEEPPWGCVATFSDAWRSRAERWTPTT